MAPEKRLAPDQISGTDQIGSPPVQLSGTPGPGDVIVAASPTTATWAPSPPGTPSPTVAPETAFGLAPNPGVSLQYAAGDHTHGTPPDPGSSNRFLPLRNESGLTICPK